MVVRGAETWFVAADVCAILEHSDASKAVSRLKDFEKGTSIVRTPGGEQTLNIVNESGLYALIFTSRKPQAEAFRCWVTAVLLPTLRQTGSFNQLEDAGAEPAPRAPSSGPSV
jgi:prophage antirepressor-like protein